MTDQNNAAEEPTNAPEESTNAPVSDEQTAEVAPEVDSAQDAAEAPEQDTTEDDPKGNREAAKYRTQLREAEAERDTLRTQLDTFRKQAVFDGLGATFSDPADYFLRGGQVHTADDGTIDVHAVMADAGRILTDASHLRKGHGVPAPNPMQGSSGGGSPEPAGPSWKDALRGGR